MRTRLETLALIRQIRRDPEIGKEWIARYQNGDREAGSLLARAHFPLVRMVTIRHSRPWYPDWDDCLQEGTLGALEGCRKFDPTRGSVSTCLVLWIRHAVQRFVMDKGQTVRIPCNQYMGKKGQPAAESIWKPRSKVFTEMLSARLVADGVSFEDNLVDERALADESFTDAEAEVVRARLVGWFLVRCTAMQAGVLRRRFAETPETLKQIGDSHGLTKERIRQIEEQALTDSRLRALRAGIAIGEAPTFEHWLVKAADVLFGHHVTRRSAA